jgi:cold shock protein
MLSDMKADDIHTGTVLFYNNIKGWGFIKDVNGMDIFFHVTGLENEMVQKDEKVTFKIGANKKGQSIAVEIIKI